LNYVTSVFVSELVIACHAAGLDPALAVLHSDKDGRASLAYDLIEPGRGVLESWFLRWLADATFSVRDFRTDLSGVVRVTHPLNSHLAMTAPLWREPAETLIAWFVRALVTGKPERLQLAPVEIEVEARHRARRWRTGNPLQRPIPATCRECGKALSQRRRRFCSDTCSVFFHGGAPVAAGLAAIAKARAARAAAGVRETGAVSSITAVSVREWRRSPGWSRARDAELVEWYRAAILPELQQEDGPRPVDIRRALRCGVTYSIEIKHDKRQPHPRLIAALAALVGVQYRSNSAICPDRSSAQT
jgi:CRISPR-associated protein Cas1